MQFRTSFGLAAFIGATTLVAACGDDDPASPPPLPTGGKAGTSGSAGAASGAAGTAGTGGAAGTAGTGGGGTAGTAGTAGTGGTPVPIVPTVFLIDNVRLQLKGAGGEGGGSGGAPVAGAGGAGGDVAVGGAGGAASLGGAGGDPAVLGGAPAGGAASGGAADGGAPAAVPAEEFLLTFDANITPLAFNGAGFSPGPGGSGGPAIVNATTLAWEDGTGNPGGAAKVSVPLSVATQQADVAGTLAPPQDLTGYELTADVKIVSAGDIGDCPTAWMYVFGGDGYANDATGEPAMGQTNHLVVGEWTTVRLDLDGPYGYHTTVGFTPASIGVWGIQFNTWGCP